MDAEEARARFASCAVARLATVRPDGAPHLVPVVFALEIDAGSDVIWTAVDAKPKRGPRLQRLRNLDHDPRCALLADHYDDEWSRLWWVRADGEASPPQHPDESSPGLQSLIAKYPQYRAAPPPGPLLAIRVLRWSGWSADPDQGRGGR